MADAARLRRGQVPGHLRHHLAKFIRLVARAAQNRRHHLVRQKVVEHRPGAVAFGAPEPTRASEPFRAYRPPARATHDAAALLESSTPDRDPEPKRPQPP